MKTRTKGRTANMAAPEQVSDSRPKNDVDFMVRMDNVVEHCAIGIALAVGYRVGLIKALAELEEPKTSLEIAEKAGLNERYVREWLGIMVVALIVDVDKEKNTYFLPRGKVKHLLGAIRRFSFEQFFTMFPPIINELEACFRNGGGIPYTSYNGFHKVMDMMSAAGHRENLLQHHIPSIEGLHDKLDTGIKCLDIGCGMGSPGLLMGKRYTKSEFYGFDISEEAIEHAKKEAAIQGLKNVHFIVKDCAEYSQEYEEMFDFISAHDAIHDQAKPAEVLSCIYKMLKKDGIFSMVDVDAHSHPADNIDLPKATLKYTYSLFHCMPVSLFFEGGAGLGTCWGRELAVKMLKEAGFSSIKIKDYSGESFNINYLAKKE